MNIEKKIEKLQKISRTPKTTKYVVKNKYDQQEYIYKVISTESKKQCKDLEVAFAAHQASKEYGALEIHDVSFGMPYSEVLFARINGSELNAYCTKAKGSSEIKIAHCIYKVICRLADLYHYGLGMPVHTKNVYLSSVEDVYFDFIHPIEEEDTSLVIPVGEKKSGQYMYQLLRTTYGNITKKSRYNLQKYVDYTKSITNRKAALEHYLSYEPSDYKRGEYSLDKMIEDLGEVLAKNTHKKKKIKKYSKLTSGQLLLSSFVVSTLVMSGAYPIYSNYIKEYYEKRIEKKKKEITKENKEIRKLVIDRGVHNEYKSFLMNSYALKKDQENNIVPVRDNYKHQKKYEQFFIDVEDLYNTKSLLLTFEMNEKLLVKTKNLMEVIYNSNGVSKKNQIQLYQHFSYIDPKIEYYFLEKLLQLEITEYNTSYFFDQEYKNKYIPWRVLSTKENVKTELQDTYVFDDEISLHGLLHKYYLAKNIYNDAQVLEIMIRDIINQEKNEEFQDDSIHDYLKEIRKNNILEKELDKNNKNEYFELEKINVTLHKNFLEEVREVFKEYKYQNYEENKEKLLEQLDFTYTMCMCKYHQISYDLFSNFAEHSTAFNMHKKAEEVMLEEIYNIVTSEEKARIKKNKEIRKKGYTHNYFYFFEK